ncbi:MAG: nuclease-related domain-containing protein [Limisphaerales bacterium]
MIGVCKRLAEHLQPLFASGYQIFHDIRGEGKWNIDPVAIGPAGVFAIETKYRTKKPGKNGARDYDATFDGSRITFSSGNYDDRAAAQARENGRWLAAELSKATGERVTVQAIVALPGWYVALKANSDVKVLSGRQVAGFIAKEPAKLSEKRIQPFSYQIEQRCRNIEF